jgi:hypothetical protein
VAYQNGWEFHGKKNWDNESAEGPKAVGAGLYQVKLVEATPKASSTGKPMISVRWEIVSASDDANSDFVGRKVFDNWLLSDGEAFRMMNFSQVSGVEPPDSLDYDTVDAFCKQVEGTTVAVMMRSRKQDGRDRAEVDYYGEERPGGGSNGNGSSERQPSRPARPSGKSKPAQRSR